MARTQIEMRFAAADFETLLDAVKWVESRGNPNAISPAGAKGAYQFTDATAKDYGLVDPFNEIEARAAAGRKLIADYEKLGEVELALAAYNCGRGRVIKALNMKRASKSFYGISHLLPEETQNYVPAVLKRYYQLRKA